MSMNVELFTGKWELTSGYKTQEKWLCLPYQLLTASNLLGAPLHLMQVIHAAVISWTPQ